jgi:hypothetical protein
MRTRKSLAHGVDRSVGRVKDADRIAAPVSRFEGGLTAAANLAEPMVRVEIRDRAAQGGCKGLQ